MVKISKIWIEEYLDHRAIRIDWDNDWHQRIPLEEDTAQGNCLSLHCAATLAEMHFSGQDNEDEDRC
jgi:hypothetical protein